MYIEKNIDDYVIPDEIPIDKYIKIFFKKLEIKWVLQEFSNKEAYEIACEVIKKTKHTKFCGIKKAFFCKNKSELKIIYKILYEKYYSQPKFNDIDLSEVAINILKQRSE